jgi:hypothetical protein
MSSSVHSCTPTKRIAARLLCKSPLYFQWFTNCLFTKFLSLIPIQTAPGGGGGIDISQPKPKARHRLSPSESKRCITRRANHHGIISLHKTYGGRGQSPLVYTERIQQRLLATRHSSLPVATSYQFVGCTPPAQCGRIGSRAFLRGLTR